MVRNIYYYYNNIHSQEIRHSNEFSVLIKIERVLSVGSPARCETTGKYVGVVYQNQTNYNYKLCAADGRNPVLPAVIYRLPRWRIATCVACTTAVLVLVSILGSGECFDDL